MPRQDKRYVLVVSLLGILCILVSSKGKILISIGLIWDIAGVFLLSVYSLAYKRSPKEDKKHENHYHRIVLIGFLLVYWGFFMQLCGNWFGP